MKIYSGYSNLIMYLVPFVLLGVGVFTKTNWTILLQCFVFIAWDIGFLLGSNSFSNRSVEQVSAHINRSSAFISTFLPFYGVLLGFLFVLEPIKQKAFVSLLEHSGINIWLLLLPLILLSFGLFFFPIEISESSTDGQLKPTKSLKSLFVWRALVGKISIFIFVHSIVRMAYSIAIVNS